MNRTIYVTGHRHPDTDSICSAITYSNLLRQLNQDSIPLRQGPLNEETKFVLKRFHQENPLLMTDARMRLEDIDLDQPTLIRKSSTVHHAWHVMLKTKNRSLFVMDENDELCGVCTTSNLSSVRLQKDADLDALMSTASLDDIARTIGGKIIYRPKKFVTNGSIHIITLDGKEASMFDLKGGISILSSGTEKQEYLIEEGVKCLVVTCGQGVENSVVKLAQQYDCAIVETDRDTMHTAKVITESYTIEHVMTNTVISFSSDEFVDDAAQKMTKSRVRSYPVLNEMGQVVGAVSRYHTRNYERRKLVLVDHSATNQSIAHVDQADLQAIIDHHHVGDIQTDHPINYRAIKCGCTCTIIAGLYRENGVMPDSDMAGLMMSAILSDTLNFKSATTTDMDKEAVGWLSKIAGITDVSAYAHEMLSSSVALKDSTPDEILRRDLKTFEFGKYRLAIGQTNYNRIEDVQLIMPAFRAHLEQKQNDKKLDLMVMLFTHVLGEGSVFVFYGSLSYIIADLIQTKFDDHYGFDPNIISRKQQLLPKLSQIIKNL